MLDLLVFSGGLVLVPNLELQVFCGLLPNGKSIGFLTTESEYHVLMQNIALAIGVSSITIDYNDHNFDYLVCFGCEPNKNYSSMVLKLASLCEISQNLEIKKLVWGKLKNIFLYSC